MLKGFQIEVCVSSKLYDLVAQSAKQTLWEMGYRDMLLNLQREIYYLLEIMAENKDGVRFIAKDVVCKTSLFVNPNKDTFTIGRKKQESVDVLIWYINEKRGTIIKDSLENCGYPAITSVFVGELWHFFGKKEAVPPMVEDLLANPHSQCYKIF